MNEKNLRLKPGDLVEVKTPNEISKTLDPDGTLEQLPFMREMVEFCGKRFTVFRRVVKVCASGTRSGSTLREFPTDDVFLLDGLRCSGSDHDACQKMCMIFWREAWLRRVEEGCAPTAVQQAEKDMLKARLKTMLGPATYFCQASELLRATQNLSKLKGYSMCFRDIRAGNSNLLEMVMRVGVFLFWKAWRLLLGPYGRGNNRATPTETLHLQPRDLVEVKPMESISKTLDQTASNRGLWFSPNMRLQCGRQQRVERRIEKLIVDGTGEMRCLRNTVFLEDSLCSCAHVSFGGCSRAEYVYWREIWLSRCDKAATRAELSSGATQNI